MHVTKEFNIIHEVRIKGINATIDVAELLTPILQEQFDKFYTVVRNAFTPTKDYISKREL